MAFLIDGYNLLHASGELQKGRRERPLQHARESLLRLLARELSVELRAETTIVFDANTPRRSDASAEQEFQGMRVLFAEQHDDADELLETLIRGWPQPRQLTVVSSDLRIQRAARRRHATAVGSDQWLYHLPQLRQAPEEKEAAAPAKPSQAPTADEIAFWTQEFRQPRQ